MDLQTVLTAVESWPAEDRLRLMEQIWDGLLAQGHEPVLSEAQRSEIEVRLADDDEAPDDLVPWEEVKAEALRRAGQ
ncbi:MAG TPA: addiction module protein [Isosphaeraceae bacterium]|nr:addiction module protein [Isosphaeraceae bacterium]